MNSGWHHIPGRKKHTQDGINLVSLMKGIGHGYKPVCAIDVGCGDGIIAFEMINKRKVTKVVAIDILKEAVQIAEQNLTPYKSQTEIYRISAQQFFRKKAYWDRFDRFVINPPYFVEGSGEKPQNHLDGVARYDQSLPLKAWALGAKRLLKTGGELYCVFTTERLSELCVALSKNSIEPKEIWFLKQYKQKHRFFLRAIRSAKPGLRIHFDV